jgi:hypothetical protein
MPCVPYAGPGVGFYAIPPLEANIWVEFEGGDSNYPIWTGCFWEEGQVPLETPPPGTVVFKTESITLIVSDLPAVVGITLEVLPEGSPINIALDSGGVQIDIEETTAILSSEAINFTSGEVALESDDINLSGAALTVESDETNIAGNTLTIESDETNIAGNTLTIESDEFNILSASLDIESAEFNILSASLDIESAESNILSAAVSLEGTLEIVGALTEDGIPIVPLL